MRLVILHGVRTPTQDNSPQTFPRTFLREKFAFVKNYPPPENVPANTPRVMHFRLDIPKGFPQDISSGEKFPQSIPAEHHCRWAACYFLMSCVIRLSWRRWASECTLNSHVAHHLIVCRVGEYWRNMRSHRGVDCSRAWRVFEHSDDHTWTRTQVSLSCFDYSCSCTPCCSLFTGKPTSF